MSHRYRVDNTVSLRVRADDADEAQIIARNALENATESDGVFGVFTDPRHCHAKEAPE